MAAGQNITGIAVGGGCPPGQLINIGQRNVAVDIIARQFLQAAFGQGLIALENDAGNLEFLKLGPFGRFLVGRCRHIERRAETRRIRARTEPLIDPARIGRRLRHRRAGHTCIK